MKTRLLYFVVLLFQCTAILEAQEITITSLKGGGPWNDPNIWKDGYLPGKNTNVIITSDLVWIPVGTFECKSLTVQSGATLTNSENVGASGLTVNENVVNDGVIRHTDVNEYFYISIKGNISNNGTWNIFETNLIGTQDQVLSLGSGKSFEGPHFNNMDTSGVIKANTDLTFKTGTEFFVFPTWTALDMQNHNLVLDGINRPTLEYLNEGSINGAVIFNPKNITCINNGVLQSVYCKGTYGLNGTVLLAGNLTFEGNITVGGTLKRGAGINWLRINGNIINNGLIDEDVSIEVTGNITNNGTWKPNTTYLTGTQDQGLSQGSGKSFEGVHFINADTSGVIKANTDLTFRTGTDFLVSSTWTTLDMQNHNLVLDGINRPTLAYLNLGLINGAVILNPKNISCINNGVLQSVNCKGTYGLNDTVLLAGYLTFEGAVTVNGKLRHGAAIGSLGVNGNIINNGLIDEDLSIEVTGDITNNGIWKAANTYLYTNGINRKIKGTFISRVNLQQTGTPAAGNVQVDGTLNIKSDLFLWSGILEVLSSGALYNYGTINFLGGGIVNKGKIVYPKKITSPGNYSFYHGSANVPSGTNLDSLLFEHYGYQVHSTFGNACKSRWNIITVPAINMQPKATSITFYYEDGELGSNKESTLNAWHSMNADTWAMVSTPTNIVRDTNANSITLTNVPLYGNYGFASSTPVSVKRDNEVVIPKEFSLDQNYPNPFNPSTIIRFSVPTTSYVSLKIYDLLGRDISMLISETLTAGTYERKFNGSSLPSGIYFYRIQAGTFSATRKLVLQK